MLLEALVHCLSRLASAGVSFLLFALVGRYCSPGDTKVIYFFSFALGFLIVSLRTFSTMSAALEGGHRKARKLRTALAVTGQMLILQAVAVVVAFAVFRTHPISWQLAIAACSVVAVSSFDGDLLRASLNKRSLFSLTFASGSALALVVFLLAPAKTKETGCAALLLQWVPVTAVNVYFYCRLLWRRARVRRLLAGVQWPGLVGSLLVAVFDGAVLNAPFLVGSRLSAKTGVDISVAIRIFVSSLPMYPLVMHWSNSGTLGRIADRIGVPELRLYSGVVAVSGAFAGIVLALIYVHVSGKQLTWAQYVLSLVLLLSYSYYAAQMRYHAREAGGRKCLFVLSGLLGVFYLVFIAGTRLREVSAVAIVGAQALTLLISSVLVSRMASARVSIAQQESVPVAYV